MCIRDRLVEGVDEERLTDACRRILIAKFQLGIFENPYVDEENAAQVLGSEEHRAVAKEAAARSFTLLKYENASPLAGQKLVVAGTLAEGGRADPDGARDALMATMSCKAAIKGGQKNGPEELRRVAEAVMSGAVKYCPHGRPVAVELTRNQLEKLFKRA